MDYKTQRINNIDALIEREKTQRFQLKTQDDDFIYQPEKKRFSFYQFCRLANPGKTQEAKRKYKHFSDDIHEFRKLVFNEEYEIVSQKEALISYSKLKKFIDKTPDHKYALYETYEIKFIDRPSDLEIYTANSDILNGNSFLPAYQENKGHSDYTGDSMGNPNAFMLSD